MEKLFVYAFFILSSVVVGIIFLYKRLYVDDDGSEVNFGVQKDPEGFDVEYIKPAQREHVAYQSQQLGIFYTAMKRAPRIILTTILIQLSLMLFTGYLSVKNIERLAMAGSALVQGEYGLAVTALWPIGKDAMLDQTRIARGVHPFLTENNLPEFVYIGKIGDKHYAEMEALYTLGDHDAKLSKDVDSEEIMLTSADMAIDLCQEKYGKYNGNLISIEGWDLGRSHILSARNVKENPKIPEWVNQKHKDDADLYMVLSKSSGVREFAKKEGIDLKDDGLYIDGDDLEISGFRCEITW